MDGMTKLPLVVSMVVLVVVASCARVPQEDQGPPSDGSRNTDANSTSVVPPAESSGSIPESPTPNDVSSAVEPDSQRQSVRPPAARTSDYLGSAIDLNSGDLRQTRGFADRPPRYDIYETGLSREVRRLGIPIPEQRRWMHINSLSHGGIYVDSAYRNVLPDALDLLRILEEVNASDEQRRDVLQRLMTIWQTGAPDYKVALLIGEVGNPHGLDRPSRPFGSRRIEELRYLGSE